jgi:hypothetical protein
MSSRGEAEKFHIKGQDPSLAAQGDSLGMARELEVIVGF